MSDEAPTPDPRATIAEALGLDNITDEDRELFAARPGGIRWSPGEEAGFAAQKRVTELEQRIAELESRIVTVDIDGRSITFDKVAECEAALAQAEARIEQLEAERDNALGWLVVSGPDRRWCDNEESAHDLAERLTNRYPYNPEGFIVCHVVPVEVPNEQ